ncbi:MAG: sigma factor-like helix-turn-helix DNA-binding protein [Eubacteriales bacterium]
MKSLEELAEKGFEPPAPNTDVFKIWDKREQEKFELRQEQRRKEKLSERKKQLEEVLTPRQAKAYFLFQYLKIKKVEIAKSMGITEGAVRKLILKARANLEKQRVEDEQALLIPMLFSARVYRGYDFFCLFCYIIEGLFVNKIFMRKVSPLSG